MYVTLSCLHRNYRAFIIFINYMDTVKYSFRPVHIQCRLRGYVGNRDNIQEVSIFFFPLYAGFQFDRSSSSIARSGVRN